MRRALALTALAALAIWGCQPTPAVDTSAQSQQADSQATQGQAAQSQAAEPAASQPETPAAATEPAATTTASTSESEPDKPRSQLPKSDKSLIPLAKDVESAMAQAKKEGKFVLMKFEAEWCGPCQLMKKEAFNDSSVAALLKDAVVVPIDLDDRATLPLQKKYQVSSIPYLVFAEPNGDVFGAILGYESTDWLKRRITQHLANRPSR